MKILLYNWVPFDNKNGRGGGVTVYLHNLVDELIKNYNNEIELFFLSSGCYYDIYDTSTRYEEISNIYGMKCRSFSIINSPVFSPAYLSFYYLEEVIQNESIKAVFSCFLDEYGPFDVVHFHNFEGLSIRILDCKQEHSETKFIYTLHNYYPFCPQVNLWKEEYCNCNETDTGKACLKCINTHAPVDKLQRKMAMTYSLRKNPSKRLEEAYKYCGKQLDRYYEALEKSEISQSDLERLKNSLIYYRKVFVEAINKNVDFILAVSKRVREIAIRMGVSSDKVRVCYIGTKVAEFALNSANSIYKDNILSIIYMGYQRPDKGYYFLMKVLDRMPKEISRKMDVTIVAKKYPNSTYGDIEIETGKFHSFISKNGYSKEEMPSLLMNKNLGIIPVLWEDNLPQIAIEMTAFGVPVLASDLGGASELCDSEEFVFKGGNVDDCINKIIYFVENPEKLKNYWLNYKKLTTMKDHIDEIIQYWS